MKKVLIIDDDTSIQEALRAILDYGGYKVEASDSIEKILKQKTEELPDLILLDLLLSGLDGRELAKQLKNDPRLGHIPIIMLSAHPSAAKSAKEGGADAFIAKPFDMNDLLDTVRRLIK